MTLYRSKLPELVRQKSNLIPPQQGSPASFTNYMKTQETQRANSVEGQNYQGFQFNVPNGISIQNLQLPGDCFFLLGHFASWDVATSPGFNVPLTMSLNNYNAFNVVDLQVLSVMRNIPAPGYIPIHKMTTPSSILTLAFNNGTGATVQNVNYVLIYKASVK